MDITYRPQVSASAPGKVIIFGEHFVVYNSKAIVAAINRRCFGRAEFTGNLGVWITSDLEMKSNPYTIEHAAVRDAPSKKKLLEPLSTFCRNILREYALDIGLKIYIKSELPIGVGLGSSAASCVMLAGILRWIIRRNHEHEEISSTDRKWICENALYGEQMIHNKSSGVDCYVSTYGGLVHFAGFTETTSIKSQPLPFFLINTRRSHETSELVSHVRRFSKNRPKHFEELTSDATAICSNGVKAMANGSLEEIGRLMTENHKLLREIGVSIKEIEKIIGICSRYGSLGAKITGAGGGGSVLVLARPETMPAINVALKGLDLCSEAIEIENRGLTID